MYLWPWRCGSGRGAQWGSCSAAAPPVRTASARRRRGTWPPSRRYPQASQPAPRRRPPSPGRIVTTTGRGPQATARSGSPAGRGSRSIPVRVREMTAWLKMSAELAPLPLALLRAAWLSFSMFLGHTPLPWRPHRRR
jgi:hypothetical protein